jgi:hypothetical protein
MFHNNTMRKHLSFVAFVVVATALSCCILSTEAFLTQNPPAVVTTKNLVSSRNAFFGFGEKMMDKTSSVLIERTKEIIYNESGFYSNYNEDAFSDEFVFRGPIIGPLNKKDYLKTMDTFGIYKSFPDIDPNAWGFSIDPKNPNRVWFMIRHTGTFTGEPIAPNSINFQPNGAKLEGCPETFNIIFDEEQKVKYLSVGYVADRFEGNTNGKGAAIGIFNLIGLPFPKVGPIQRFFQWFGTEVVDAGALSYSAKEEIPKWWKDESICADGYL